MDSEEDCCGLAVLVLVLSLSMRVSPKNGTVSSGPDDMVMFPPAYLDLVRGKVWHPGLSFFRLGSELKQAGASANGLDIGLKLPSMMFLPSS